MDYLKQIKEATEGWLTCIEHLIGMEISYEGSKFTLKGCNNCGILYWQYKSREFTLESTSPYYCVDSLLNKL